MTYVYATMLLGIRAVAMSSVGWQIGFIQTDEDNCVFTTAAETSASVDRAHSDEEILSSPSVQHLGAGT